MLIRNQSISHATLFALAVGLPAGGCSLTGEIQTGLEGQSQRGDARASDPSTDDSALPPRPPELQVECKTLNFDHDSAGQPIEAGRILTDAYAGDGIEIRAFRRPEGDKYGIPVAFDSNHPTGGDDDLAFDVLDNLLISQECWDQKEFDKGLVKEPDDNALGARFEFLFDEPVCIRGLTLLDIDLSEEPVAIEFFAADGTPVFDTSVPPMGNNERIDVTLQNQDECNVARAVVKLSGSGAMDNLEICESPDAGDDVFTDVPSLAGAQEGTGVAADAFGNVLVTGTDNGAVFLRKLAPSGDVLFSTNVVAGTAAAVAVQGDRNPVVFGTDSDGRLFLTRFNAAGESQGTLSPASLEATAVDVTTVGSDIFFVANVAASGDVVVGKVDETNDVDVAFFDSSPAGENTLDTAAAIAADRNGTVAVAVNGSAAFVVTFDSNLVPTVLPLAGLLDPNFGVVTGVAYNSEGHILVVGDEQGLPTTVRLLKLDSDGSLVKDPVEFINDSDDDFSAGVAVDSADNVIVAGSVVNADGNFDVWVRKVDANLDGLFPATLDVSGDDVVNDVTTDFAGNIIVTGRTDGDGADLLTVKFTP